MIEARDYDEAIVPLIEAKLASHSRIKLIYRIGPEFEAFTPSAVWSDTFVGIKHLTRFSTVAVVTDIGWIRHAMRLFAPMIPAEVQVFSDSALDEAKVWIAT